MFVCQNMMLLRDIFIVSIRFSYGYFNFIFWYFNYYLANVIKMSVCPTDFFRNNFIGCLCFVRNKNVCERIGEKKITDRSKTVRRQRFQHV